MRDGVLGNRGAIVVSTDRVRSKVLGVMAVIINDLRDRQGSRVGTWMDGDEHDIRSGLGELGKSCIQGSTWRCNE